MKKSNLEKIELEIHVKIEAILIIPQKHAKSNPVNTANPMVGTKESPELTKQKTARMSRRYKKQGTMKLEH